MTDFDGISDKKRTMAGAAIAKLTNFLKIKGNFLESRVSFYTMQQWDAFSAQLVNFMNNYTDMRDLVFWNRLKAPTKAAVAHLFQLKDQDPMRLKVECTREKAELYILLTGSASMVNSSNGETSELYPGQVVGAIEFFDKPKKVKNAAIPTTYTITLQKGCFLKLSFSDYYNQVVCPVKEEQAPKPKSNSEEAQEHLNVVLDTALNDDVRQFLEDSQILGDFLSPDADPEAYGKDGKKRKKRKKKRKPEECGNNIQTDGVYQGDGPGSISSLDGRPQRMNSVSPSKQIQEYGFHEVDVDENSGTGSVKRQGSMMLQRVNSMNMSPGTSGSMLSRQMSNAVRAAQRQNSMKLLQQMEDSDDKQQQPLTRGNSFSPSKPVRQSSVKSISRQSSNPVQSDSGISKQVSTASLRHGNGNINSSSNRQFDDVEDSLGDYSMGGGLGDDNGDEDYCDGENEDYYCEDGDNMYSQDESGAGCVELADTNAFGENGNDSDSEYYYSDEDDDDVSVTAGGASTSSVASSHQSHSRHIMYGSINRNLVVRKGDVRKVFIILEGSVRILVANRSKNAGTIAGRRIEDGIVQGIKNRIMPLMTLDTGAMLSISPEVFTVADGYVPFTGKRAGNSTFGRKIEKDIERSKTIVNTSDPASSSITDTDPFEEEDAVERPNYDIIIAFQKPTIYISIPYNIFRSAMRDKPGSVTMELSRTIAQIAGSFVDRLVPLLPWLFGGVVVELTPEEEERREKEARRKLFKTRQAQPLCGQLSDMKPSGLSGTYYDALKNSPSKEAKDVQ